MRIAYVLTHPIQYQAPMIRHLIQSGIKLHVLYATDMTAGGFHDAGFGQKVQWDVPLLDGYPHEVFFPKSALPAGLANVGYYRTRLRASLEALRPDAVWVHGWGNPYSLAAILEARRMKLPVLLRGEAHLEGVRGSRLRRLVHRLLLSQLFRRTAHFLAIGSANELFYRHYGVPASRISRMPYTVDNAFFQQRCQKAARNRETLRASLNTAPERPIVLFSGKFIQVKDPATLIRAVGKLATTHSAATCPHLIMVGDGELRGAMEELAAKVAPGQVTFPGFRNQTELPAFYDLCDIFVLPSQFEPWGLVVNEVMNAAKPVIVSDQVGSGADLVKPGVNGGIFRAGDVDGLCAMLQPLLDDETARLRAGQESLNFINRWSFNEDLAGLREAMKSLHLEDDN